MQYRRLLLALIALAFFSCKKNSSSENNNDGTNGVCNKVMQHIVKWQNLVIADEYLAVNYDGSGRLNNIKMNLSLSEYRNSTFEYDNNGRIKQAIVRDNRIGNIVDTIVYRYNAAGKVDSMYMKQDNGWHYILSYDGNGNVVKFSLSSGTTTEHYWDLTYDNGNIKRAVLYNRNSNGTYAKETTLDYTYDDRKNPFQTIAMYMFYLDDEDRILRVSGPNNFINETYTRQSSGNTGTSGYKYKYNVNCYPETNQVTLSGQPVSSNPSFAYTYQ